MGEQITIVLLLKPHVMNRCLKSRQIIGRPLRLFICVGKILKIVISQMSTALGLSLSRRALSAPCISIFRFKSKPASNKMARWLPAGWIFAFLALGTLTEASHFRLGSIMWAPDDSNNNTV